MARRIVVINPNSTDRITDSVREAVGDHPGVDVEVVTSSRGPAAIESDSDVAASVAPLLATAANRFGDAYVVACFSDPGLDELRAVSGVPCFGIAESAMRSAMVDGPVGVVSSVDDSIARHDRYWRRLGLDDHVVGDIAVGLGVLELDTDAAYAKVRRAAGQLVDAGAASVILGCTGMTHMVDDLEAELGVRVVDPSRAAVTAAAQAVGVESTL